MSILNPYYGMIVLYLLGSLFILQFLQSEDNDPYSMKIIILALTWPFYTLFLIIHDIFFYRER